MSFDLGQCYDEINDWQDGHGYAASNKDIFTQNRHWFGGGASERETMVIQKKGGLSHFERRLPDGSARLNVSQWLTVQAADEPTSGANAPVVYSREDRNQQMIKLIAISIAIRASRPTRGIDVLKLKEIHLSAGSPANIKAALAVIRACYGSEAQAGELRLSRATTDLAWAINNVGNVGAVSRTQQKAAGPEPAWCSEVGTNLLAAQHLTDPGAKEVAEAAISDMRGFAARERLPAPTSTNVSEEGLVSLVWRSAGTSVLMVFSGDGDGSFSISQTGQFFEEVTDLVLADELPAIARSALWVMPDP